MSPYPLLPNLGGISFKYGPVLSIMVYDGYIRIPDWWPFWRPIVGTTDTLGLGPFERKK